MRPVPFTKVRRNGLVQATDDPLERASIAAQLFDLQLASPERPPDPACVKQEQGQGQQQEHEKQKEDL